MDDFSRDVRDSPQGERGRSLRQLPISVLSLTVFVTFQLVGCRPPASSPPGTRSPTTVPEPAPFVGYQPRACGFDLDDDGKIGEPFDDCRVCDGRTRDPDGDGVDEDLLYVDCAFGMDDLACGSPQNPCRTLAFAWSSRADGPEDGAEDILCFSGRCAPERQGPLRPGVPGFRAVAPRGSQVQTVELPTDPAMLVGWDRDADGIYPPLDEDDVAILDGGGTRQAGGGLSRPFVLGADASRLEMAHFSVLDYGRYSHEERSGFVSFYERGRLRADHFYFHDLVLDGINRDQPTQGFRIVFDFFTGGTAFHHLVFSNLQLLDVSGFMVRGSGPYKPPSEAAGGDDGPYRWQGLTVTAHGCDHSDEACRRGGGSAFIGWKLWGYLSGVEILDSVFDAQVAAWEPKPRGNGGALLVYANQCSRRWTVRGNRILDFKVGVRAEGGEGPYCGWVGDQRPRRTGEILVDRNVFWNRYEPWHSGDHAIELRGGADVDRTLDDVVVSHNILASSDGFDACIVVDVGHDGRQVNTAAGEDPSPGRIVLSGNTCWGSRAEGQSVGLLIGSHRPRDVRQDDVLVVGNLFAGLDRRDVAWRFLQPPASLVAAGNVVAPSAGYVLGDGASRRRFGDLEAFEAALGREDLATACIPALADPLSGDFHRLISDACSGSRWPESHHPTVVEAHDVDGEARPSAGPWDAGADQSPPGRK